MSAKNRESSDRRLYFSERDLAEREPKTRPIITRLARVRDALSKAESERDRMRRLFNRLDAAVSHHRKAGGFEEVHDEALYKARDRIINDYAEGKG